MMRFFKIVHCIWNRNTAIYSFKIVILKKKKLFRLYRTAMYPPPSTLFMYTLSKLLDFGSLSDKV